jgi:RHS repeat-associated protein
MPAGKTWRFAHWSYTSSYYDFLDDYTESLVNASTSPHATTTLNGQVKYAYDANGNLAYRLVGSDLFTYIYDIENHLTGVKKNGADAASFVYDADGNRIKGVINGTPDVTTYYLNQYYERTVSGSSTIEKRYYYAGGQRIAMQVKGDPANNGLHYLLSDTLGSTTFSVKDSGGTTCETRYAAWGTSRSTFGCGTGGLLTTFRYTGQRQEVSLGGSDGLYYYVARFYDPSIGRFTSPDTVVPNQYDPSSYDRFNYVGNNPIMKNDPTGHCPWCIVGALVGAAAAYGIQVYNNYQSGNSSPWTSNISAEAIVGGALIGTGAVLFAPAVVALIGDAAVGTGLITGSTALFAGGQGLYGVASTMEANIVAAAPGKPLPVLQYDPETSSEVIDADYKSQAVNGKPRVLSYTNDKDLAEENRAASTGSYPTRPKVHRHEYPHASTYNGGSNADVTYVNKFDNASHGYALKEFYAANGRVDGFKFYVDVGYNGTAAWPAEYYGAYGFSLTKRSKDR